MGIMEKVACAVESVELEKDALRVSSIGKMVERGIKSRAAKAATLPRKARLALFDRTMRQVQRVRGNAYARYGKHGIDEAKSAYHLGASSVIKSPETHAKVLNKLRYGK